MDEAWGLELEDDLIFATLPHLYFLDPSPAAREAGTCFLATWTCIPTYGGRRRPHLHDLPSSLFPGSLPRRGGGGGAPAPAEVLAGP